MSDTKIEWADKTWNPVTGCTAISTGCKNCYAKRMANRLRGRCGYPEDEPFRVTLHPGRLNQPLKWKKPCTIFVCSMGDLFHDDVPFEYIHEIWDIMKKCPQHIFKVLTKRPKRALEVISHIYKMEALGYAKGFWEHVQIGVTAENQETADERVPVLVKIPAKYRFVSAEPLLENIHFGVSLFQVIAFDHDRIDGNINQVIVGAETGPGKRHMDLGWARSIRNQCQDAGVKFFFKKDSDGNRLLDGRLWEES